MNDSDETMCDSQEGEVFSQHGSPSILGGLHINAKNAVFQTEKEDLATTSRKIPIEEETKNLKRECQDDFSFSTVRSAGISDGSLSPQYPPLCSKIKKLRPNSFESSFSLKDEYSESCNSTQDFDSQIIGDTLTSDSQEFEVIQKGIAGIEEQVSALMMLKEKGTLVTATKQFTNLKQKMQDARLLLSQLNTLHQKQREELTTFNQNPDGYRTSKQDLVMLASKQRRLLQLFKRYEELLGKAKLLKNTPHTKHMKKLLPSLEGLSNSLNKRSAKEQGAVTVQGLGHVDVTARQDTHHATVQGSGHVDTTARQDTHHATVQGSGHVDTAVRQDTHHTTTVQGSGHVDTAARQDTHHTTTVQGSGHVDTAARQDTHHTTTVQGSGHVDVTARQETHHATVQGSGHVDTAVRQDTHHTTTVQGSGHVDTTARQDTHHATVQGSGYVDTTARQDTHHATVQGSGHGDIAARQDTHHATVQGSGHVDTAARQDTHHTTTVQGSGHVDVTARHDTHHATLKQVPLLPNCKLIYLVNTVNTVPTASVHGVSSTATSTTGSAKKSGTTNTLKVNPLQHKSDDITITSSSRPVVSQTSNDASRDTNRVVPLTYSHRQVSAPNTQQSATKTTLSSLTIPGKNVPVLSSTTTQEDLATLLRNKVIEPGQGVLSVNIQGKIFTASLKPNGSIQSSGGEIFQTPMSWLQAVTGSKTTPRQTQAYSKVQYKGKSLASYGSSNAASQGREAIANVSSKSNLPRGIKACQLVNASSQTQSTRISDANHSNPRSSCVSLSTLLTNNCTVRIISDDELIPTASILPPDFWSRSFDTIDLDPKLFIF